MNIQWQPSSTYSSKPAKKTQLEGDVRSAPETSNAASRGATTAVIKGGEHSSKSDSRKHLTVEYKNSSGGHVTTKHVHT